MLRVGITGGIGSGKSTVCRIFEAFGVPIYNADIETKKLYSTNQGLKADITAAFGPNIYTLDGTLNKALLADIVFSDTEKLSLLNHIVHPYVFKDFDAWCESNKHCSYVLKEAAIMFESGSHKQLDVIIGVIAPDEVRIERTIKRDGMSREDVLQRMHKQLPTDQLKQRCDYIINNDGSNSLIVQVVELHNILKAKSLE